MLKEKSVLVAAAVVGMSLMQMAQTKPSWSKLQHGVAGSGNPERFVVADETDPQAAAKRAAVISVFQQVLGRSPTEYEIKLYSDYATDPNDMQMIVRYLEDTAEYKAKMQASSGATSSTNTSTDTQINVSSVTMTASGGATTTSYQPPSKEQLQLYRSIIDVYNKVLDRMPSTNEIDFYVVRMSKAGLSLDGLRQLLEASNEYRILQKDQTNKVNAELPGNITEAQLVLDVREVYASVHGANVLPSQLLEDFLKSKYVEYSLSKPKLRSFLLLLARLDGSSYEVEGDVTAAVCSDMRTDAASGTAQITSASASHTSTTVATQSASPASQSQSSSQPSSSTSTQGQGQQTGSSSGGGGGGGGGSCSGWWPVRDEQYELLSKANGGSNGLPAKAQQCTRTAPRDPYAEAVFDRNISEVQYACERNNLYRGRHNSVDVLGTPIEDAIKTQVGSIMPRFTYKELPRDWA